MYQDGKSLLDCCKTSESKDRIRAALLERERLSGHGVLSALAGGIYAAVTRDSVTTAGSTATPASASTGTAATGPAVAGTMPRALTSPSGSAQNVVSAPNTPLIAGTADGKPLPAAVPARVQDDTALLSNGSGKGGQAASAKHGRSKGNKGGASGEEKCLLM